jgi:tetratricopeptide (TPR) repeat protein
MVIQSYNPTPFVHSFLFWSNPSVHANEDYQVIFPPSVEYVTQHHKREMTTWPISDRRYNRYDYSGKDISMWKNTGVPSSFFAWDPKEDFFGGYDHNKQAGTAWIGNHHTMPGMKYWADGNNPAGRMINDGLTDDDGQYIELMAGAFTDNQPDYSWIQPYERKNELMTWFPIRLLEGLKKANRDAALNLIVEENGDISIKLNSTRLFEKSRISLTYNEDEVFDETIDISPAMPYINMVSMDGIIQEENLTFTLYDVADKPILVYQPATSSDNPMPEPIEAPPSPEEVETVEELYLHGLRLDQFHNANISSMPYYEEALRRDPGDYQVNTKLGILFTKNFDYEKAEEHLQKAVDRITMRYTRPMDSDALYYLGLVKRMLDKDKEAYNLFYDASWNAGWHTQSFHQLAELDTKNGDYEKALNHINRALSTNVDNLKAQGLKITILRKLGKLEEAKELAYNLKKKDLLFYHPRNELYYIYKEINEPEEANNALNRLDEIIEDRVQSYLEFSTDYAGSGFYNEAIDILTRLVEKGDTYPLTYYYLGYYWSLLGYDDKAEQYFSMAQTKPHDYTFPFRAESIKVLNTAISYFPKDHMAYYYLGNLYYESQSEKAVELWEKSLSLSDEFYIVHRNLAWAAQEKDDHETALKHYSTAFNLNNQDERLMFEYDNSLVNAGVSPEERYTIIFENNRNISQQQSNTYLRELELLIWLENYDEVIDIVTTTEFVEPEGSRVLRDIFHNVHILKSLKEYNSDNFNNAITYIEAALEYPIGRWGSERRAQMYYLFGKYLEGADSNLEAAEYYQRAVSDLVYGTEYHYYKGLAYKKLGQFENAELHFESLIELADSRDVTTDAFISFEIGTAGAARQAQNEYLRGLALLGRGMETEAKLQFQKVIEMNPNHLWAHAHLEVF